MIQQSHFWLYNQRTISKRYLHAYIHFHHDSQQRRYGNNLNALQNILQQMNKENVIYIYIEYYSTFKKEGNPVNLQQYE